MNKTKEMTPFQAMKTYGIGSREHQSALRQMDRETAGRRTAHIINTSVKVIS